MALNFRQHEPETEAERGAAPMGHNAPPIATDWADLLDPVGLQMLLQSEHGGLLRKRDVLLARFKEWQEDTAQGLTSDEQAENSTDFGAQIKRLAKNVEDTRGVVKAPFVVADRTVQTFFRGIGEQLEGAVKQIERSIGAYKNAKAAHAKREADALALQQREEANRIAAAAVSSLSPDLLEQAQIVEQQASQAEKVAAAPLAEFSRTRGAYGVSSASVRYEYEVLDLTAVPLDWLVIDDAKVRRAINGKGRITEIPGLKISEVATTHIR